MSTVLQSTVEHDVRVSDYVLARIGGAAASGLEPLIFSRTAAELQRAFAYESAAADLAPTVESALFRVVPRVAHEKSVCRRILGLKRSVHNGGEVAAGDCAEAAALVDDPKERQALLEWHRLVVGYQKHLASAKAAHEEEMQRACTATRTLLDDGELQKGLAIASPGLVDALLRARNQSSSTQWRPSSRLARSVVSYYARIALKTSPFSTFTPIDLWDLGKEPPRRPRQTGCAATAVRLARMLPMTWLEIIARDRELAPALKFELNPTLRGGRLVLQGRFSLHESFAWRDESMSPLREVDCDERLLHGLRSLAPTFAYSELVATAEGGVTQPDKDSVVRRLLDAHVVRPMAPFARQEAAPVRQLAQALSATGSARGTRLAELMRQVAEAVEAFGEAAAGDRIQILRQIRQQSMEVFADLRVPAPEWVKTHSLVYESARWGGRPAFLPAAVQHEVEQVMRLARQRMVRSKLAEFVYRYFLERFGPEGETGDIAGFLGDFLHREDFRELVARALAEDRRAIALRRSQSAAGDPARVTPPAAAVFFQIAASSPEALQRGDFKLVINQVSSGHGGLLGRFVDLLDDPPTMLAARLREWLTALKPDSVVLEMPVVNDWSNLHPVVGACDQILRWPGEIGTANAVSEERQLDDLLLRADAENGVLYFVDRQGRNVSPVYLGVAPTQRIQGALGLFLLLLDPWVSDHSIGRSQRRFASTNSPSEEIEFSPREEQGRLVLRRAQWRVPMARLPRQSKAEGDFEFLVRMQRWQRENGIPEEVFAECEAADFTLAGAPKPAWIHFHSPHTLSVLANAIAPETMAVRLTEVLPARDQHWYASEGGSSHQPDHRVTECVALAASVDREREPTVGRKHVPCSVRATDRDWLYFKIYPGSLQLMDETVRSIVAPAIGSVSAGAVERWFFVRYIDERGPHIRFRLRPKMGTSGLRDSLVDLIESRLPTLRDERSRRRLVPSRTPDSSGNWRGLLQPVYQPEYVKYGGPPVIDIVEQAFEQSSAIALRVLADNMDAVIGAAFMHAALESSTVDPEWFWAHYLWHWTGQYERGAAEARGFFLTTARERRALFAHRLSAVTFPAAASRFVSEFGALISGTLNRIRTLSSGEHAEAARFDLIHLHNNRLGIVPTEEAYLAGLLKVRHEEKIQSTAERHVSLLSSSCT